MHIVKSLLVLLFLVVITLTFIYLFIKYVHKSWIAGSRVLSALVTLIVGAVALLSHINLWQYTYPFERKLDLKLVATLEIPPEHTLHGPQNLPWHALYEQYGVFYPESLYFINIEEESYLGFSWPDMDFDHYTYIISYGQKVESLSYNVWETIEVPFHNGARVGHAVLSNEFDPNEVYVYQIKKIRIDNDS